MYEPPDPLRLYLSVQYLSSKFIPNLYLGIGHIQYIYLYRGHSLQQFAIIARSDNFALDFSFEGGGINMWDPKKKRAALLTTRHD